MWIYEKKLEFPVKIKKPDARLDKIMIKQYGGADGELAAALRYISQKFTMVTPQAKATLNDIGTEESAHICYHLPSLHPFISPIPGLKTCYSLKNIKYFYCFSKIN